MEQCERCQKLGEDRRTIWLACFYDMSELNVPFEQYAILGQVCDFIGKEQLKTIPFTVPVWSEPKGDPRHHQFFTLRVCKECRADFMQAVEQFFRSIPTPKESPGTDIFIRDKGATIEVGREDLEKAVKIAKAVVTEKEFWKRKQVACSRYSPMGTSEDEQGTPCNPEACYTCGMPKDAHDSHTP